MDILGCGFSPRLAIKLSSLRGGLSLASWWKGAVMEPGPGIQFCLGRESQGATMSPVRTWQVEPSSFVDVEGKFTHTKEWNSKQPQI